MKSKGKILAALAVILVGFAAAWMFRRTDVAGQPPADTSGDELVLREQDGDVSNAPSTAGAASYLLGKIDSLLPSTSTERSSTDNDATEPAATETQPTTKQADANPQLPVKPPWGTAKAVQAPRWSVNANATTESPKSSATERPPAQPKRRTHKIADGDTLSLLAARYLGNADRYVEIFEANKAVLPGPDLLPIGVEIVIPPKNQFRPTPAVERPPAATNSVGMNRAPSPMPHNANGSTPKNPANAGAAPPPATIADPPIKRLVPVPPPTSNNVGPSK